MNETADFCWVGADGALHSGTKRALLAALESGRLPMDHPVWHPLWTEWVPLDEAVARRLLEPNGPDAPPSTVPTPMRFDEPETPLVSLSSPTLLQEIDAARLDADATLEDLTVPRGMAFVPESRVPESLAPESLAPTTLPSLREESPAWVPPPAPAAAADWTRSDAPPALTHSITPAPPERPRRSLAPALLGLSIAMVGASVASGLIALALIPERSSLALHLPLPELGPATPRSAPSPAFTGCRAHGLPTVLSDRVELGTPVEVARNESGAVSVGVVTTTRSGQGLVLALDPPAVTSRVLVTDPDHVAGVVQTGSSFAADRFARTVPAAHRFSLGMTPSGLSRIAEDGSQTLIWGGEASQIITRPALAHAEGLGWAVAFRRGGDTASIRVGWIDELGAKKSELATLCVASGLVEAPSVAVGTNDLVVAYATRQPAEAPWGIELAHAKLGELPASSRRLDGGGEDRHAPSVAALPGGRFLVAWAEGSKQNGRELRARVLDASLRPVGEPFALWHGASFVGTTSLVVSGDRVVVLFTERVSRQTERLLAAGLECR